MIGIIMLDITLVNTRMRIINMPYLSRKKYPLNIEGGRKTAKTFEPSSGGIGIRLNTPRPTFMKSMFCMIDLIAPERINCGKNRISARHTKAVRRFPAAPAMLTSAMSLPGRLKFLELIGTGLAQPNGKKSSISVPIGSR